MKIGSRQYFCLAFSVLLFTVLSPITILMGCLSIFFLARYSRQIIEEYMRMGIISFLPESVKDQLMNRSLFDFLCDFWFMESLEIFKVCLKPFLTQIQPETAADALNDLPERTREKFLTKGIVRMLPEDCQRLVLSVEDVKFLSERQLKSEHQIFGKEPDLPRKQQTSQISFKVFDNDNQSEISSAPSIVNIIPTRKKVCSHAEIASENDIESPLMLSRQYSQLSIDTMRRPKSQKWDKLEFYHSIRDKLESQGIVQTAQSVMSMVRKVIELKNFSSNVHKTNSSLIVKIMVFFWFAVLVQMRLNKHARRMIFKTIYVMSGVLFVTGALTTTAVLLYKYSGSEKPPKLIKPQKSRKYRY